MGDADAANWGLRPVNCSARFGSLRSSPTMDFSVSVRRTTTPQFHWRPAARVTLTPGAAASGGGRWPMSAFRYHVVLYAMRNNTVDAVNGGGGFVYSEWTTLRRATTTQPRRRRSKSTQRGLVDVVASTRRASSGRTEDGRRRRRMEYVTAARVTTSIAAGMARVLRSVCTLLSRAIISTWRNIHG